MAHSTLMQAFHLKELRRHFEPDFERKQAAREKKKKLEEEKAAEKRKLKDPDEFDLDIDQMKEDPDEIQKNMGSEPIENLKLAPILKEAYELLVSIESKSVEANKKIAALNEQKRELKKKQNAAATGQGASIQSDDAPAKILFKTIMCPLKDDCSNHTGHRWPMSSAPCTT